MFAMLTRFFRQSNILRAFVFRNHKMNRNKTLEWAGVGTAILYSLLLALNIGVEFIGFTLLLLSALLLGLWAHGGGHKGMLLLQVFYATAALIGMVRWF